MAASKSGRDFLGLASFGIFLIVIGAFFALYPGLTGKFREFIMDFDLVEISQGFYLPVTRGTHPEVYSFFLWLSVAMVVANLLIFGIRFAIRDPLRRKADTLSGIIFWAGMAFLSDQLLAMNLEFQLVYSYFIIILGISIMTSGVGLYLARRASGR